MTSRESLKLPKAGDDEVIDNGPLRRRLLEALAHTPDRPGTLAERLGVSKEAVSRNLRALREAGLVESRSVFGDGRLREYVLTQDGAAHDVVADGPDHADDEGAAGLTAVGEVALSDLRAFGVPESPPDPLVSDELEAILDAAMRDAVALRRRAGGLEEVVERLRAIVEEAETADLTEIVVEATAELATTLRQERRDGEVEPLITKLNAIALEPGTNARIALPAAAHRSYALGRLAAVDSPALLACAGHLVSAAELYGQMANAPGWSRSEDWQRRQTWSVASLAHNFLEQSRYDEAIALGQQALARFEALEDLYGSSNSRLLIGFAFRAMGDYGASWEALEQAHVMAKEHGYRRIEAGSLMQMGEVRRCQGHGAEARSWLEACLDLAEPMELGVTQAFAWSALGAVAYQDLDLDKATAALERARFLFGQCNHRMGIALNLRRQAIVARRALDVGCANDVGPIAKLVAAALERYQLLKSPAGAIACEIEEGRLALRLGGSGSIVGRLLTRLTDTRQRNLIEQDPWVPRVLVDFAQDADDPVLTERSGELLESAERRLAWPQEDDGGRAIAVDEMGGESRREIGAAELVAA